MSSFNLRISSLVVAVALAFPLGQTVHAQVPIYATPTNKVGSALASGIAQTLIRRGFAANDPRLIQTIASVSARVPVVAAAAGTGATWLTAAARLSPWVTGGVLVYQGVTWYWDLQGKVYLAPPGSTSSTPIYSNGIVAGQLCWGVNSDCFGSPQEVLSFLFATTRAQYPKATYGVPTLVSNSATQWTGSYNYSIPELGLNNYSGSKVIVSHSANVSCPKGGGYSGTGSTPNTCLSAQLDNSPYSGAPLVGSLPQAAYDALPDPAKIAALSPELAADIANRHWRDAAQQPDYQGVPFSTSAPVSPVDFSPSITDHPSDWPRTSGLNEPVPTTSPVSLPTTNPNQTASPSSATKIDLGVDPGTPPPTFEDLPTDLMKPIKDVMAPWLAWQVPSHTASCPVWNASPSISGHIFVINVSSHCDIVEHWRTLIAGIALAGWVIIAAFVVLSS